MEIRKIIRDETSFPILSDELRNVPKKNGKKNIQRWVRVGRGKPIGVVLSNGINSVGWSLCSKQDDFDMNKGVEIARQREKDKDLSKIPYSIKKEVEAMLERSKKVKAFQA